MKCCICGKEISLGTQDRYGNNAEPVRPFPNSCCDECNYNIVVPLRQSLEPMSKPERADITAKWETMSYAQLLEEVHRLEKKES